MGRAAVLAALLVLSPPDAKAARTDAPSPFADEFCRAVGARPTASGDLEIFSANASLAVRRLLAQGVIAPRNAWTVVLGPDDWLDLRRTVRVRSGREESIAFQLTDPRGLLVANRLQHLDASTILANATLTAPAITNDARIPFDVFGLFTVSPGGELSFVSLVGTLDLARRTLTIVDIAPGGDARWFSDATGAVYAREDYGRLDGQPEDEASTFRFWSDERGEWTSPVQAPSWAYQPVLPAGTLPALALSRLDGDARGLVTHPTAQNRPTLLWRTPGVDVRSVWAGGNGPILEFDDSLRTQIGPDGKTVSDRLLYADASLQITAADDADGMTVTARGANQGLWTVRVDCETIASDRSSASPGAPWLYRIEANPTGRGDFILSRPASGQPQGLVALLKGGPWTHDAVGVDETVLWLLRNGWAVVQVNYTGSSGFGGAFEQAIFADDGAQAGADVLAAIERSQQIVGVGPARTGLIGFSYGGLIAIRSVLPARSALAPWALVYPAFDYPYRRYRTFRDQPIGTIHPSINHWCALPYSPSSPAGMSIFVSGDDHVVDPGAAVRFAAVCSGRVNAHVEVLQGAPHGIVRRDRAELRAGLERLFGAPGSATPMDLP